MAKKDHNPQVLPPELVQQLQASLPPEGKQMLDELLAGAPPEQVLVKVAAAAGLTQEDLQRLLAQPEAIEDLANQALAGGKVDEARLRALMEQSGPTDQPPAAKPRRSPGKAGPAENG